MKKFLKCYSIFLTLVLLFHMVPLQVFALGTEQPGSPKETEPARIVEEVVSERTEYTKTYRMDNGTFTAAVYNTPVHYLSEETWQEIDNTLRTMNDGTYANTAGVWDVRFPQELSDEKAVTITKDGNTLSFYMAGKLTEQDSSGSVSALEQPLTEEATVTINGSTETFAVSSSQTADAQIQQLEDPEAESVDSRMVLEKSASRLTYENVYSNTHVQYDLQGNQVKESVILESYQSDLRGYRYVLETGSMVPVLNSDGSIDFLDEEEALVMRMPAPFLVDQNGEVSSDVQVALAGKGGMYVLVYLLPEQWLSSQERAWPVVLDPVVIADPDALSNIKDRGVASGATYAIDRVYLECGHSTTTGINRFYIKFSNLPELSSSDVILGADLRLRRISSTGDGGIPVEAHKVLGTWESATINWSNKPAFDETIEDYQIVDANGDYHWDITDVVRGWYSGENTGVMFKTDEASENATIKNYRQFYSSDTGIPDRMPTLIVYYRNNNGLEGYWDYTSASAGRAGTGYVNSYTGNMVWIRGDMGFGGNRMPVSISHVYNLNDADNNEFSMGNGWRTNLNQKVYRWSANTNYYIWEDADGTDHYFVYNTQTQRIEDEDGLGLVLNTGTDEWKYSITDKNGNVSYFDSYGRLTRIVNNRTPADPDEAASDGTEEEQPIPSSISIGYSGSTCKITTVTDGAGRKYYFSYDTNTGLLKKIEFQGVDEASLYTVSYTYTGNNLTAITDTGVDVDPGEIVDAESQTTTYTYLTGTSILESAQDIDGYKLVYSYYTPTADYQPYRVHQIREYSGTEDGGVLTIEYAHNQTTFTDRNGNIQILQFNDFGNTVSVQDGEGRAQYAQYLTNSHTETGKANQLNLSSKLQNTVGNRLPDSSFEGSSTSWHPAGNASAAYTPSTAESYLGSQSLALAGSVTATTESAAIAAGETVTFSAYVKGSGVKLQLGTASSETTGSNAAWTRLQVSYTNNTAASVSLAPKIVSSGTGTVYIDCVQLEKAPTASRYNLIQNGDFRDNAAWSNTAGICIYQTEDGQEDIAAPQLEHRVYSLSGIMTEANRVSQTVNVSGAAGDTFVISGWAKGDSVPTPEAEEGQNQRRFAVAATFHYTNGETKTFYANFNPDTDSSVRWQYAAQVMVAEEAYSSVTVELCYDYNANTVYFDGIGLYKETFGSSYTYDEDGNVTSVVDLQKQTTTYEYQDNNLTKATLPTGAELTYTYDDYHNVTRATSATGVVYEFGYDAYGNNTTVSIVGADGKKITSSAAYSDDGNTLVSTTDAAGMVTRYHYNADTNVLEWVQYPNDSDTSRTEYTYDSMYRAASAAAEISDTVTQSVVYTYENDLLKTLTTPSTTYSFSYGAFSLRSKISIGTRDLATYSYTDINHYLQSLDYGNGDKVQYTYDTLGRVTCQTYEDGDTVTYRYDNDGALATVTDSATGRTTTYYYDFIDRLVKYVETGEDYYHSVGYGYDTINNLTAVNETINGITFTTSYAYDMDNRVTSVTSGGTERTYTYDAYSRITQRITKQGEAEILKQNLIYKDGPDTDPDTDLTTGQVYRLTNDAAGYDKTYEYTYDGNGNIQTVFDGTYTTRYVYDTANQLIRENNQELGKTWTWTYDAAGNIVNRKEYAYTTAVTLGTPTDTVLYGYTDATWGDLLTSYDGTGIIYDDVGNPLTDGTWTYTWEHGRQLAGLYGEDVNGGLNDVTVTYTYNADGMRTGKTVVTRTYEENHTHVYSAQIVPPTCTQQGYTLHTCACGASYKDTYVAALGHTVSNGRCIRCGYVGGITPPITPPGGGEIMSVTAGDTAVVLSTGTRVLESTKTVNYQYVYNGGSLSQMVVTTTIDNGTPTVYTFHFQYDASGTPMSMVVNGSEKLYYVTNLQGDVTALLDEDGNEVAEYTYSAYGEINPQVYITGAEAFVGAMFNPLKYRGYVHDIETDWYYLQSRYYDPEIGRFINADALVSTGQGFEGNNMLAYCLNNPTVLADYDGEDAIYVVDYLLPYGLPAVGHARLFFQTADGMWYVTEFTGKCDKQLVYLRPADMNEVNAMLNGDYLFGKHYVHIPGDFSKTHDYAMQHEGTNYGGYGFLTNNCLHYVHAAILAGEPDGDFFRMEIELITTNCPAQYYYILRDVVRRKKFYERFLESCFEDEGVE